MNKVLMYCQGLLGVGHLMRFVNIANAISGKVVIVYGGEPVKGIIPPNHVSIVHQPAVRSDWTFSNISSVQNPDQPLEKLQEEREKILIKAIKDLEPTAFVIDSFPFSRRKFAPEIIPAIKLVREKFKSCKVITSLRDKNYHRPNQANYQEKVLSKLEKYIDLVIVHSDPLIADKNHPLLFQAPLPIPHVYTGYVVNPNLLSHQPIKSPQKTLSIVVQIGGGRVGNDLFRKVHDALPYINYPVKVHAYRGAFKPDVNGFQPTHPNFNYLPFSSSYFKELQKADLLISQCGYNSMTDALLSKVRWVAFPFAVTGEQTLRANWLLRQGILSSILPEDATTNQTAQIINTQLNPLQLNEKNRQFLLSNINLNGAPTAAHIICGEVEEAFERNIFKEKIA